MNDCLNQSTAVAEQAHAHPDVVRDLGHAPVLINAKSLRVAFNGQHVLDGVDLELREGEVVLLRGENGSGKTTLLNILTGNLHPDAGVVRYSTQGKSREYHFPRSWWQELNVFDHFAPEFVAREGIGRTWQDSRLFGSQTIQANIAVAHQDNPGESPLRALLSPVRSQRREQEIARDANDLLARFSLGQQSREAADAVSLGQSKRVAAARAVAAGARVLFLDEPLAGLDSAGVAEVLCMLEALVHSENITIVIVEHIYNQPHLRRMVTTDWLLAGGKLIRSAASSIAKPRASAKLSRPRWLEQLIGPEHEVVDELLPRGALLTRIRPCGVGKRASAPLLDVRALLVRRGHRIVLGLDDTGEASGCNFQINTGEITILQAPNGWGKTTLAEVLSGTLAETSGTITLAGQSLAGIPPWVRRRAGICIVPATGACFSDLTVAEQMALAKISPEQNLLAPFRTRRVSALSGGERQVLALATLLAEPRPRLRVVDEPFAQLDASNIQETLPFLIPRGDEATLILVPTLSPSEEPKTQ